MNPSFFGPPGEQLLGIHHPARGASKSHGVVLCPPAPQETARTHWAFRKLAELLSKAGFDVLRFDYRGTGDSSGELENTSPAMWIEDIRRATKELKDLTGLRKVSAVGFRFGALLLARAASEGLSLEKLVLWEPVVSAANWLERLRLLERQQYRDLSRPPKEDPSIVLGFVMTDALLAEWQALELTDVPIWAAKTAIVASERSAHLDRLQRHLDRHHQTTSWHYVDAAGAEAKKAGALLGNEALEQIAQVLK
ncbi:MAG: alpha/beta fold hydrolase [Archangium sp.]